MFSERVSLLEFLITDELKPTFLHVRFLISESGAIYLPIELSNRKERTV